MRVFLAILVLLAGIASAQAQGFPGYLGAGHAWGNPTAAEAEARDTSLSALFDQAFCNTNGQSISRVGGTWACSSAGAGSVTSVQIIAGTGLSESGTCTITTIGACTLSITNQISAAGPIGSATATPVITFNAQGQLTAVTSTTVTPAWGSITGTPTTLSGYGITSPLPVNQGGTASASASGTALDNITGFSGTGFIKRTGAGAYTFTADPSDVTSVSNSDGSLTISPTTGAVIASIAPAHSNVFTAAQGINLNSGALPAAQTGAGFRFGQADGVTARMELDAFAAVPRFTCVREDGTAASPTTLQANDEICSLNAFGFNGTAIVGPQVALRTYAAQNWSVGANGTYARIGTTPNGSTTLTDDIGIENDGGLTVPPSVTGGSKGAGTLNLSGGYYVGGAALAFSNIAGTLAAAQCPLATTGAFGCVKPDGTSITISAGVISASSGSGTVTSVGLSLPGIFSVSGSPVTGSGTLTGTLATQSANLVWAGPTTGAAAAPTFRGLVTADLPAGVGTVTSVGTSGCGTGGAITTAGTVAVTPATNSNIWGAASNDCIDAAGASSALGLTSLTDAATIALDMSTFVNATVTLGGNRTLGNPSNTQVGRCGTIYIVQDGTGSRTLAYSGNWKFQGGTAPTLSTAIGAVDALSYCVRSSTFIVGALSKAFS